jgi:uncharacterized protein (TIGR01777 family)
LRGAEPGEVYLQWDGKTLGPWAAAFEGTHLVVNLAGRSVNCRYTEENLREMMDSRVDSARVVGQAIAQCKVAPKLWLQMSTATIYAHRFDAPNDDDAGVIGGREPDAPGYWEYSVRIAKNWEEALFSAETPHTRRVALRASMVMGPARGGIFDTLYGLTGARLGGSIAGGRQYVSWIHEVDFIAALDHILEDREIEGPIIIASPTPLPQAEFMLGLRQAMGIRLGLPATAWMAAIGAVFMRTDTELILKSRRVVPSWLLERGFEFQYPRWPEAAQQLVAERRKL